MKKLRQNFKRVGQPIDGKGEVGEKERMPIHRNPPSYEEQAESSELLETGIKVIDLMCPFAKGGKVVCLAELVLEKP